MLKSFSLSNPNPFQSNKKTNVYYKSANGLISLSFSGSPSSAVKGTYAQFETFYDHFQHCHNKKSRPLTSYSQLLSNPNPKNVAFTQSLPSEDGPG